VVGDLASGLLIGFGCAVAARPNAEPGEFHDLLGLFRLSRELLRLD